MGESSMASERRSSISSEVEEGGWGEGREEEEVGGSFLVESTPLVERSSPSLLVFSPGLG